MDLVYLHIYTTVQNPKICVNDSMYWGRKNVGNREIISPDLPTQLGLVVADSVT